MNEVLIIPDHDWVIHKLNKYNGDTGYYYLAQHKHGTRLIPTYSKADHGVMNRYKCSLCDEPVPDEVEGFAKLCEWSEV